MTPVLLKLTQQNHDESEVWIGASHIIYLEPSRGGGSVVFVDTPPASPTNQRSLVVHAGGRTSRFDVKESPQEINDQLKAKVAAMGGARGDQ